MLKKLLILAIVVIVIIGVAATIASSNFESNSNISNNNVQDSPNIIDSITTDTNKPDSFINENGTKTYIINAIDSPVLKP